MSSYRLKPTSTQPKSDDFSRYLIAVFVIALVTIVIYIIGTCSQNESQRRRCADQLDSVEYNPIDNVWNAHKTDIMPKIVLKSRKIRGVLKWMTFGAMANRFRSHDEIEYEFRRGAFDEENNEGYNRLNGKNVTLVKMTKKASHGFNEQAKLAILKEVHFDKEVVVNEKKYFRVVFILKALNLIGRACNREVLIRQNRIEGFVRKIMDWNNMTGTAQKQILTKSGFHAKLNDDANSLKIVFAGTDSRQIKETIKRALNIKETLPYTGVGMMVRSELSKTGIEKRINKLTEELKRLEKVHTSMA